MTPDLSLMSESAFVALTEFLQVHQPLWSSAPFKQPQCEWQHSYPDLYNKLLSLTDAECERAERDPLSLMHLHSPHIDGLAAMTEQFQLPVAATSGAFEPRLSTGVPGRKWQQIEAFAGVFEPPAASHTILDWCAGKAYLGRALAHQHQMQLHAVEYDAGLCEKGRALASPWVNDVHFDCHNVLEHHYMFNQQTAVVALHACGDLHRHLLRQWQQSDSPYLQLSPCCYHKWLEAGYQPLSELAAQHDLGLSAEQVQLAVQETVTASVREQKQVATMQIYRLAFDELQRVIRDQDSYLNTPSLPYGVLAEGFESVMRRLAHLKEIPLPATVDWCHFLTRGQQRFDAFRRLQLANHAFRRLLEMWLVLDIAHYLRESGCRVQVTQFCDKPLTPRNISVVASR